MNEDRCPACGREGVPVHGKVECPKCHILLRWWWHRYDKPDWRTRLMRPFLHVEPPVGESWEYKWSVKEERGWEKVGVHPLHDQPGRKAMLLRKKVK